MGALLMSEDRKTERVLIKDLYVVCALQVMNFDRGGVAMSDCCRRNAETGVMGDSGITTWRCRIHEGVVDFRTGERGEVVHTVLRFVD